MGRGGRGNSENEKEGSVRKMPAEIVFIEGKGKGKGREGRIILSLTCSSPLPMHTQCLT